MTALIFANNATTTLAGAITNTAVTFNVAAGGGALFPNPIPGQYFVITFVDAATGLTNEIMWCTGRSGDTFTVVRAQEGTTAKGWIPGDIVSELWTAGQAAAMQQAGTVPSSLIYYGDDTGTVNSIVTTVTPAISALATGNTFEITPLFSNTSSTVLLNVSALGARNVYRYDGSALYIGDIQAAPFKAWITWDASATKMLLQNPCVWVSSPNITFAGADSGTTNAYVLTTTAPPAPAALVSGQQFRVRITNSNSGASTLTVTLQNGGTTTKNIIRADGSALQINDLVSGEVVLLNYDGTNLQLSGVVTGNSPPRNTVGLTTAGSGTFTVPSGIYWLWVRLVGAGGGGGTPGTGNSFSAGGGGSGGYTEGWIAVVPGQVISYTVGAGGAGSASFNIPGTTGGTSSFGAFSATGGTGGVLTSVTGTGGIPGLGAGGSFNLPGANGGDGNPILGSTQGGAGAASAFGGGGRTSTVGHPASSVADGVAAGSGGGGIWGGGSSNLTAGKGSDGAVFIQY